MKKVKKVLLCILLLLVAGAAGAVCWQWDNLKALTMAYTNSPEDIQTMIDENDERIAQATQKVEGVTVRDLTEEEKEELKSGTLDREQVLDRLTAAAPAENASAPGAGSQTGQGTAGPAEQESGGTAPSDPPAETTEQTQQDANRQQLSRYLAEIYVMKAEYTAWLEQKYAEAIDKFNALDPSQQTADAKYSIGMGYLEEALAKEEECDAQMAELEQKISALLTEMGEDTSLVDDIHETYETEKELQKAYYLG